MIRAALKRFSTGLLPILTLFVLQMGSLYMLSNATQNAAQFDRSFLWLLLLNVILLLLLIALISVNVFVLVRQVLRREPGSRLTLRLMLMFVVLALVPVAIVYTFSIWMLERGVDSWFDVRVEHALEDALELSRASFDLQMRQLRQQTEPLVSELEDTPEQIAPLVLSGMLRQTRAVEMTLFGANNRIIASVGEMIGTMLPHLPGSSVVRLVSHGETYVGLEPGSGSGFHIRLVFPVPSPPQEREQRIFQVLYPVSDRINTLASSVQDAFGKYNKLVYLRKPLKQSFTLTLTLVLLLGVLFAVWAAFFSSRRLIAPIRELAEGTKAVAAGEYHKKLPVGRRDDLGLLVLSFNQMTDRLAEARDAADSSQRLLEHQRTYLETVLQHLSSGVLSLDETLTLRTVNATASHILGVDLEAYLGGPLRNLGREHPMFERLCESLEPVLNGSAPEWREQVNLFSSSGRKVLMCRGARLPTGSGLPGGHVIVFDDVTALIQAQRDAAWGEVARRLAHEIKNPLTPIQLSAERLRSKLSPDLDSPEAQILERSTNTIVQQVESMKTMVNAFGDYARTPTMEVAPLDLHTQIRDVIELYRSNTTGTELVLEPDPDDPHIEGDPVRVRQLLHNLIKNSLEALEGNPQGTIRVATQCVEESGVRFVNVTIDDNGPGLPQDLMDRLFEPYVTSKTRGNGLGLAIVKKIAEEHNGVVWAESNAAGGARIGLRLLLLTGDLKARPVANPSEAV